MSATILIVDDDKFTRTVLETIFYQDPQFSHRALEVVVACDGEDGLNAYESCQPRIVVVDLLMPKIDGFELCKRIRSSSHGDTVHLICISGVYRDAAISQRIYNEYRAEFYTKPYQLKEMAQRVAELLDSSGPIASPIIERIETASPSNREGELADTRVPALLLDFLESKASGQLVLQRGKVSKRISLLVGHPVNVASSIRDETLGHFLMSQGIISTEEHQEAVRRSAGGDQRIGESLIEMGALTPAQLVEQLTAQIQFKLAQTFRWNDGTWSFTPMDNPTGIGSNPVDIVNLIIAGLRDTASFTPLPPHIRQLENRQLYLPERGQRLAESLRGSLLDYWHDGNTISDLLAANVERSDLYSSLEILVLCDALHATEPRLRETQAISTELASSMSVEDLSEHSVVARLPRSGDSKDDLYSLLFEEATGLNPMLDTGAHPLAVTEDTAPNGPGDSGYIDIRDMPAAVASAARDGSIDPDSNAARRGLLEEYLRIKGLDHYGVLAVATDADAATISAAVVERRSRFSRDWFARFDLGRDYAKLEEIHAAYDTAFNTLLDEKRRAHYDATKDDLLPGDDFAAPSLDAEIHFHEGDELLRAGKYHEAIVKLKLAVEQAPNEASYRAVLGWSYYLRGRRTENAADEARPHLNAALAINVDHAIAHEYKGVITSELAIDDAEARFHLERALDADPTREEALTALENMWRRKNEFRPLERQYRRLIYRAAGRNSKLELSLWLKLAEVYRNDLDDPQNARVAYTSALGLAPEDPAIQAALADLDSGKPDRFFERSEMLRHHWLRDPASEGPGIELMRAAEQASRPDATFMAASALVARGSEDEHANDMYRRFRPRFVLRAQQQLYGDAWELVRHSDDSPEIGALLEVFAPILARAVPLTFDDLEVDDTMRVASAVVPQEVIRMRDYIAHTLGVEIPEIYVRSDFGHQIHVGAVQPAVLLAGDDALAAPERGELCYRLGRAMTFLWPGRALGGSRPARYLKYGVLAAVSMMNPSSEFEDPEGLLATIKGLLRAADPALRSDICRRVAHLTQVMPRLNLSKWSHALARTADRVGLFLCGDLPAAVRFARDTGSDIEDMIDYAISANHLHLRSRLGLSIDV